MQRLSRIGRNTLAVSVSTLLLSACNQGRRCAEACGGRAATGRTEHGCTEHPAMPQRPVRGDRPGRQAARAVRQRLRQYRRQRLPGHPDGGARGALEPDPGEGRQGVARRYRRSPVAAHPNLYGFVRDGKYGVVDGQGKEVQAPRFDDIYPNSANEFIIYEIDGKRGILDAKGKQLTEALYDTTLVNGSVAEHGGLISAERGGREVDHQPRYRRTEGRGLRGLGDLHDGVMSASVIGKGSQLVDAKGDVVGDGKSYDYLGTPANGLVAFREKYDSPWLPRLPGQGGDRRPVRRLRRLRQAGRAGPAAHGRWLVGQVRPDRSQRRLEGAAAVRFGRQRRPLRLATPSTCPAWLPSA